MRRRHGRLIGAILVIALGAPATSGMGGPAARAQAPTPQPLEVVGHVGGGPSDVAIDGRYAYVAGGYSLEVWDVGDPFQPERAGQLLRTGATPGGGSDALQRLHVRDGIGLLVDRNAVRILDLTDPAAPREAGAFRVPGAGIYDAARSGTTLYVASGVSHAGITVIDIADPATPKVLGYTADGDYTRLALEAGCLYAVAGGSNSPPAERGLRVFDVTTPASPVELSWTEGLYASYDLAVEGARLYAALNGGARIFSVGDPTDVRYLGTINTADPVDALDVEGTRATLLHGNLVEVFDVSDPGAPVSVDSQILQRVAPYTVGESGVAARGSSVVVAALSAGVFALGRSDAGDLRHVAWLGTPLPGRSYEVAAGDRRVFVLTYHHLAEVEVSDPGNPAVVAMLQPRDGSGFTDVALDGTTLCLLVESDPERLELLVEDVSMPGAPQRRAMLDVGPGWAADLVVRGSYAYVGSTHADGSSPPIYSWHVRVYDVAGIGVPRLVGDLVLPRSWSMHEGHPAMWLMGPRMLVGNYHGMTLAEVADPSHPTVAGLLDPGSPTMNVEAVLGAGDRAYLAYRSSIPGDLDNLAVVDITDPAQPTIVATRAARYAPSALALSPAHLFTGAYEGVQMFGIETAPPLVPIRSASLPARARDIALKDGYAYVADDDAGLLVLYTGDADLPVVVPPTPSPSVVPSSLPPTVTAAPWTAAPPAHTPTATATMIDPDIPTVTVTPTPTPLGALPCICRGLTRRVPPAVIADAVANPVTIPGWLVLRNPSRPPGPSNPRRTCLTLQRNSAPYHPLWNGVVWKVGCQ